MSTNVKVSGLLYRNGFSHNATIFCAISGYSCNMQHSLLHHKANNAAVYTVKYLVLRSLLAASTSWDQIHSLLLFILHGLLLLCPVLL